MQMKLYTDEIPTSIHQTQIFVQNSKHAQLNVVVCHCKCGINNNNRKSQKALFDIYFRKYNLTIQIFHVSHETCIFT